MNVHGFAAHVAGGSYAELHWCPQRCGRIEILFCEQRDWEGAVFVFVERVPRLVVVDRVPARLFAEGQGFRLQPELEFNPGMRLVMRVENRSPLYREFAGAWIGEDVDALCEATAVRP